MEYDIRNPTFAPHSTQIGKDTQHPKSFEGGVGRKLLEITSLILQEVVVHERKRIDSAIFIGVEEFMELGSIQAIMEIISELGSVGNECLSVEHSSGVLCLTSLTQWP